MEIPFTTRLWMVFFCFAKMFFIFWYNRTIRPV